MGLKCHTHNRPSGRVALLHNFSASTTLIAERAHQSRAIIKVATLNSPISDLAVVPRDFDIALNVKIATETAKKRLNRPSDPVSANTLHLRSS